MVRQLKFLLVALALVAAAGMAVGTVLVFGWPRWAGFFLFLVLGAGAAGVAVLEKIWSRHREAASAPQMIAREEVSRKKLPHKEPEARRLVQQRWKQALKRLEQSHLKKRGNPRYVLPWYLVIGPSGSGKSTVLQNAGIGSTFESQNGGRNPAATDSCQWWFFDHAIVVDTAGRYAFPVDERLDSEEWQSLVALFSRYRRKEPLNGLVITVSADRLLQSSVQANAEMGRELRRRIDELMRSLGVRFPVYVLVTKCDLIAGMEEFCTLLPEKCLFQPMGVINQDLSWSVATFTGHAMSSVMERLRALRLQLLLEPGSSGNHSVEVLFPEAFATLSEPLGAFMEGAFQENPYQETPTLRGLFFGSGRQAGSCPTGGGHLSGTGRGVFWQDLWSTILPGDRFLWAPTKRSIRWRTVTGNLGLLTWVLLMVGVSGLLGFSFIMNMRAIRDVSGQFAGTPPISGATFADLETMDGLRRGILRVEEKNRGWVISRLGLREAHHVEQGLKTKYCQQFRKVVLTTFDRELARRLELIDQATSDDQLGQYAVHLMRRINILKACLAGGDLQSLAKMPQPASLSLLSGKELPLSPQLQQKFGQLYLYYLIWRHDHADLNRETAVLQGQLRHLIAGKGGRGFSWLSSWVDRYEQIAPVTLAQFWGGANGDGNEPAIAPSLTRKGKERLETIMLELDAALGEAQLAPAKAEFHDQQRRATLSAWQAFTAAFPRGVGRLRGANEWQRLAGVMGTNQGPYLRFLDRLTLELEPLLGSGEVPVWLRQLYLVQGARTQAGLQGRGALGKVADSGKKVLSGIGELVGPGAGSGLETELVLATAWQEYGAALKEIAPAAASRPQAFQLASQTFSDDPAVGKTPFIAAHRALSRFRGALGGDGNVSEVAAKILYGPLEFLWIFVRNEAAATLQTQWEEQVVSNCVGIPAPQAAQMLLGPDGLAWRFAKGTAAPFLVRTVDGYRTKEVLGGAIPLDRAFFSYMGKGSQVIATALTKQSTYSVGIRGLPTEANADANTHPHGTRLDLICAGNTQTLINNNYPTAKTFAWSPDTCGDVIFQVEVGELVLTKQYAGPQGFSQFLQDFRGGFRTFLARDFPAEKGALERMGIRQIRANYQFTGSIPVIKQSLVAAEAQVPHSISRSY